MSTYTQILYQIVYSSKNQKRSLLKENRQDLFKYMWGILQNNKCHLYRLNGVEDHLHIITHLHSSVALSNLVKDLKLASTEFIKSNNLFPQFNGWQNGYSAFTYSIDSKNSLVEYVKNQEEHHKNVTFKAELKPLLKEHRIPFDEKYLL